MRLVVPHTAAAVSYTHLDVYKRQGQRAAAAAGAGAQICRQLFFCLGTPRASGACHRLHYRPAPYGTLHRAKLKIYDIYLQYITPDDIHSYSIMEYCYAENSDLGSLSHDRHRLPSFLRFDVSAQQQCHFLPGAGRSEAGSTGFLFLHSPDESALAQALSQHLIPVGILGHILH